VSDKWRCRLKACIDAEGNYLEHGFRRRNVSFDATAAELITVHCFLFAAKRCVD